MKTFDLTNLPTTDEQAKKMIQGTPANDDEKFLGNTLFYLYMCFREQGTPIANAYLATVQEYVIQTKPTDQEQEPTTPQYCFSKKDTPAENTHDD